MARTPPPPKGRALIASGAKVALDDRKTIDTYKRRRSEWQERAWFYAREVPEVGFAADYVRDAGARIVPYPAVLPDDPDGTPEPLTEENQLPGLSPDLARQTLERLQPYDQFMGGAFLKTFVPGECHVILMPDVDDPTGERCLVVSNDELVVRDNGFALRAGPHDSQGVPLVDAFVFRLWEPDGQWRDLPTSNLRRLLGICEELLTLTRMVESVAKARIAQGPILFVAQELSLESYAPTGSSSTDDAGDGEDMRDPFVEDLYEAATASIADPGSAAAVMPIIVRGPYNMRDGIVPVDASRKLEEVFLKLRQELIGRIANGVNLPREILLGVGGTNHWNAEQIDGQAWKIHLEPRARAVLGGTTEAFYRPMLLEAGVPVDSVMRTCVWYDPSDFIGTPDLSSHAEVAHERLTISDEAFLRAVGFSPENDMPDEAEKDRRIQEYQRLHTVIREAGVAPAGEVESPTGQESEPGKPTVTPPTAGGVQASAAPGRNAGARLVGIERDLRARLHAEVEAMLTRALERAGLKISNKLKANGRTARAMDLTSQVAGVPQAEITATLGRAAVQALGLTEERLLDGLLGDLEQKYQRLVASHQRAAVAAIAAQSDREHDDFDLDAQMDSNRKAGWLILAAGLAAIARDRLFDPHPAAPAVGEFDEHSIVPVGLVRAALDRAGGAQVDQSNPAAPRTITQTSPGPGGEPAGGGATAGPDMLDVFNAELGITQDGYRWVYGDTPRTREFEPHVDLDGVEFSSWDDDRLSYDEWPGPWLSPGDHDGCACDFEVILTQADDGGES